VPTSPTVSRRHHGRLSQPSSTVKDQSQLGRPVSPNQERVRLRTRSRRTSQILVQTKPGNPRIPIPSNLSPRQATASSGSQRWFLSDWDSLFFGGNDIDMRCFRGDFRAFAQYPVFVPFDTRYICFGLRLSARQYDGKGLDSWTVRMEGCSDMKSGLVRKSKYTKEDHIRRGTQQPPRRDRFVHLPRKQALTTLA
jgi:hypothetical protein